MLSLLSSLTQFKSFLFTILVVIMISCGHLKQSGDSTKEVVLKIDNYEVTRYEFDKQRRSQDNQLHKQNKSASEKWLSRYVDNCFIIADSYNKGYDTSKVVKLRNYYAELNMSSSVGGYYWNEVIEPTLEPSSSEVEAAYRKRAKLY
jgi:hypothetical protein